jgi:hypothetical protein
MKKFIIMLLSVCSFTFGSTVEQLNQFSNNIDAVLQKQYTQLQVTPNARVDDDAFVRRAYLSIIGRNPTYEEHQMFSKVDDVNKRASLIQYLIKHPGHISHMFNFWAESLRLRDKLNQVNNFHGALYVDYIKDQIAANKPYNEFVSNLLLSSGNYYANPAVGYYYRDLGMPMDNLIATSRVFLGTDIGCAQCHDDPFQDFTQKQFYGMAALFNQVELRSRDNKEFNDKSKILRQQVDELIKADPVKNRGLNNQVNNFVRAMRSDLTIEPNKQLKLPHDYQYKDAKPYDAVEPVVLSGKTQIKNKDDMRKDAVAWMVNSHHPTFTKNIVNRYWKWVFGKYIIEEYDNIHDSAMLDSELLNVLADVMIQVNYDNKQFLYALYNTKLFQRELYDGANADSSKFVFIGPVKHRLNAEQIWDSVIAIAVASPESFKLTFHDAYANIMQVQPVDVTLDTIRTKYDSYQKTIRGKYDAAPKYKNYALIRASEVNDASNVNTILEQLGRGDRELIDSSSQEGSVTQVISFMNGQLADIAVNKDTQLAKNVAGKSPNETIDIIFKSVLSRKPSISEKANFTGSQDDDIIWALVNSSEFKFNK